MSNLINPYRFVTGGNGFLPSDLADLEFWFDADDASTITESGGDVSQWDDKSGNGRDISQAESIKQPIITTDGGFDALLFDGGNDNLGASMTISYTEITIFVAMRQVAAPTGTDNYLTGEDGTGQSVLFRTGAADAISIIIQPSAGTSFTINDTNPEGFNTFALIMRATNDADGEWEFNDGSTETDVNVGTMRSLDGNVTFGAGASSGGAAVNCYFHEIGLYSAALSDAEKTTLMDYLKTKWGL